MQLVVLLLLLHSLRLLPVVIITITIIIVKLKTPLMQLVVLLLLLHSLCLLPVVTSAVTKKMTTSLHRLVAPTAAFDTKASAFPMSRHSKRKWPCCFRL